MFALSKKTEYALRALLDLSYHTDGEAVSLTDISARSDIPLKYLEQIMLIIKKAGLVESRRGVGGGFRLLPPPREITLGQVIRVIEGDERSTHRIHDKEQEADFKALEEVWANVTQAVSAIIDSVTFVDIMRRADELRTENSDYNFII